MKIFIFVDESMGRRIFNLLINKKINLIGLYSDRKSKDLNFYKNISKELNFKVFYNLKKQAKKLKEFLIQENVDIIINIFSYSIIPNELINIPRIGSFNLHPGKLPQYAGLNPVSWSIYNGENKHYATLHWMTKKIDSGPIVYIKSLKINEEDSALKIMEKTIKTGEFLIRKFIKQLISNPKKIPKKNQNLRKRRYYSDLIPNSGFISWSSKSQQLFNFVRAFDYKPYNSIWLEPKTIYQKKIFNIVKIKKTNRKSNSLPGTIYFDKNNYMKVSTLDNWIIVLKIKFKNKYINPLKYFKNKDKFEIN